jgi:hypothetical protein
MVSAYLSLSMTEQQVASNFFTPTNIAGEEHFNRLLITIRTINTVFTYTAYHETYPCIHPGVYCVTPSARAGCSHWFGGNMSGGYLERRLCWQKPPGIRLALLTLSVCTPGLQGPKFDWRPYFLFLLIARLFVVRLTRNQVQMKEN